MGKTKAQVLGVVGLTQAQKDRAEAFFLTQERFGKPQEMPVNTNQEVKDYLTKMVEAYEKRKEREAKKREREEAEKGQIATIKELISSAKEYGFEFEDIINAINDAVRERKNAAIRAKIAELEAQLV